jgi:uncharacterized protein (DUF849 family)
MTSPIIETDLAQILERIEQNLYDFRREVNQKFDKIDERLTKLEVGQARLEAELKGDLKALDIKMEGIGKRLENQEFISRGVLIALIVAILGGLAKLFGFLGNP